MAMDEQARLLALAHLKNGERPADIGEMVGISYSSVLKLKRELHDAEEHDAVLELFKLDKAALEMLLEGVRERMQPVVEAFGAGELVEAETTALMNGVEGGKLLNEEFQESAKALAIKIKTVGLSASNAETILALSKSLCELQRAFFGSETGGGATHLPATSFEQHLKN